MVVHPAVAVGGGVEFHLFGEGVDVLILAGDEKVPSDRNSAAKSSCSFLNCQLPTIELLQSDEGGRRRDKNRKEKSRRNIPDLLI